MLFKDENQRPLYNQKAHPVLKDTMAILDYYSHLISCKDILVTEFWREERARKSFHPKFQACDIRTKGRSRTWVNKIRDMLMMLNKEDSRIQFEYEQVGQRNEHLHIEIDTGDPV